MAILRIPADYVRGGTSKGLFFHERDLPADPAQRDRVLLRAIGSPDPYGRHIDGMGGATSSTSKVVIVRPSTRAGADVEYAFGAVAIGEPRIDWSGNCGNLTTAVGPFAIRHGLVAPVAPLTTVRLFNLNRGETIVAEVPVAGGLPCEEGDFRLDGVAFAGAGITLAFLGEPGRRLLPTGRACDRLLLPDGTSVEATLIDAGNPTVFVDATALGLRGDERPAAFADPPVLARLEAARAAAAVAMGLAPDPAHATRERPATPKLAWIAPPADFEAADGRRIPAADVDLRGRILSMGALHHAFTGTGAIAAGAAAALPGSVLSRRLGQASPRLRLGHPSGVMHVGADLAQERGEWRLLRATVRRSARLLMSGTIFVPAEQPS
jgi:hypothetical protein